LERNTLRLAKRFAPSHSQEFKGTHPVKIALLCAFLSVTISAAAQGADCRTHFKKKITINSPTVFTGTLDDDKAASIAMKAIVLTGLNRKIPQLSQVAITNAQGAFRFDSVPAGKYAISFNFSNYAVKKSEVHCATSHSCTVALIVRHYNCYSPRYDLSPGPGMGGGGP